MSILSYALLHTSKKGSKASGHLTSSFTTDKFIGMELLQYRLKNPQVTTKKLQNRTKATGNSRQLDYPDSRWEFPGILRVSKTLLNIKIRHRQPQTMFGWTIYPVL
jgi:hypothetical protein